MVISDPKWYLISFGLEMLMHSLYLSLELFHSYNGTLALSAVLKDGARFRLQNGTKPQAWQTLEDVHTRISHLNTVFFSSFLSPTLTGRWQPNKNPSLLSRLSSLKRRTEKKRKWKRKREREKEKNKWRGVTISLRTGGQGRPTPIHTLTHPQYSNIHKKYLKRSFPHFSTRWPLPTDQRTDGQTKPLIELRVRN